MIRAYIGVDGVTYRQLIEPVSIEITRREGPTYRCDRTHKATRWSECWAILRGEASTAPDFGGIETAPTIDDLLRRSRGLLPSPDDVVQIVYYSEDS